MQVVFFLLELTGCMFAMVACVLVWAVLAALAYKFGRRVFGRFLQWLNQD